MNEEAQKNIGQTLHHLFDTGLVDLVALEGVFDPIDLSVFRTFEDQESVKDMADFLLAEHEFSGPVHAAITDPKDIPPIVGVDDASFYHANIEAYKQAAPYIEKNKESLALFKKELDQTKRTTFNPELKKFDQTVQAYQEKKLSLGDFAKGLSKNNTTPALKTFLDALAIEESLDFDQVQIERTHLVKRLFSKLNSKESRDLLNQTLAYQSEQIRQTDYYSYLKNLCDKKKVPLKHFKSFQRYINYILLSDQIEAEKLFQEIQELEKNEYARLTQTEKEDELVQQSRLVYLTHKLLNFSLTSSEWNEYRNLVPLLVEEGPGVEHNSPLPLLKEDETINTQPWPFPKGKGTGIGAHEEFYRHAKNRDTAITKNLLRAMEERNAKFAILVTGGFHANGIQSRLKDAGLSTISFVPKITKVNAEEGPAYLSVFTQEKTPLEKIFQGEKLFISPSPIKGWIQGLLGIPLLSARRNPHQSAKNKFRHFFNTRLQHVTTTHSAHQTAAHVHFSETMASAVKAIKINLKLDQTNHPSKLTAQSIPSGAGTMRLFRELYARFIYWGDIEEGRKHYRFISGRFEEPLVAGFPFAAWIFYLHKDVSIELFYRGLRFVIDPLQIATLVYVVTFIAMSFLFLINHDEKDHSVAFQIRANLTFPALVVLATLPYLAYRHQVLLTLAYVLIAIFYHERTNLQNANDALSIPVPTPPPATIETPNDSLAKPEKFATELPMVSSLLHRPFMQELERVSQAQTDDDRARLSPLEDFLWKYGQTSEVQQPSTEQQLGEMGVAHHPSLMGFGQYFQTQASSPEAQGWPPDYRLMTEVEYVNWVYSLIRRKGLIYEPEQGTSEIHLALEPRNGPVDSLFLAKALYGAAHFAGLHHPLHEQKGNRVQVAMVDITHLDHGAYVDHYANVTLVGGLRPGMNLYDISTNRRDVRSDDTVGLWINEKMDYIGFAELARQWGEQDNLNTIRGLTYGQIRARALTRRWVRWRRLHEVDAIDERPPNHDIHEAALYGNHSPNFKVHLATVLFEEGQKDEAFAILEEALKEFGDDGEAEDPSRPYHGRLNLAYGKLRLEKAKTLDPDERVMDIEKAIEALNREHLLYQPYSAVKQDERYMETILLEGLAQGLLLGTDQADLEKVQRAYEVALSELAHAFSAGCESCGPLNGLETPLNHLVGLHQEITRKKKEVQDEINKERQKYLKKGQGTHHHITRRHPDAYDKFLEEKRLALLQLDDDATHLRMLIRIKRSHAIEEVYFSLAKVALRKSNSGLAKIHVNRALGLGGDHPEAYRQASLVYANHGTTPGHERLAAHYASQANGMTPQPAPQSAAMSAVAPLEFFNDGSLSLPWEFFDMSIVALFLIAVGLILTLRRKPFAMAVISLLVLMLVPIDVAGAEGLMGLAVLSTDQPDGEDPLKNAFNLNQFRSYFQNILSDIPINNKTMAEAQIYSALETAERNAAGLAITKDDLDWFLSKSVSEEYLSPDSRQRLVDRFDLADPAPQSDLEDVFKPLIPTQDRTAIFTYREDHLTNGVDPDQSLPAIEKPALFFHGAHGGVTNGRTMGNRVTKVADQASLENLTLIIEQFPDLSAIDVVLQNVLEMDGKRNSHTLQSHGLSPDEIDRTVQLSHSWEFAKRVLQLYQDGGGLPVAMDERWQKFYDFIVKKRVEHGLTPFNGLAVLENNVYARKRQIADPFKPFFDTLGETMDKSGIKTKPIKVNGNLVFYNLLMPILGGRQVYFSVLNNHRESQKIIREQRKVYLPFNDAVTLALSEQAREEQTALESTGSGVAFFLGDAHLTASIPLFIDQDENVVTFIQNLSPSAHIRLLLEDQRRGTIEPDDLLESQFIFASYLRMILTHAYYQTRSGSAEDQELSSQALEISVNRILEGKDMLTGETQIFQPFTLEEIRSFMEKNGHLGYQQDRRQNLTDGLFDFMSETDRNSSDLSEFLADPMPTFRAQETIQLTFQRFDLSQEPATPNRSTYFINDRARFSGVNQNNFREWFQSDFGSDPNDEIQKMEQALENIDRFMRDPTKFPDILSHYGHNAEDFHHNCHLGSRAVIGTFLRQVGLSYRIETLLDLNTFVVVQVAGVEFILDITAHRFEAGPSIGIVMAPVEEVNRINQAARGNETDPGLPFYDGFGRTRHVRTPVSLTSTEGETFEQALIQSNFFQRSQIIDSRNGSSPVLADIQVEHTYSHELPADSGRLLIDFESSDSPTFAVIVSGNSDQPSELEVRYHVRPQRVPYGQGEKYLDSRGDIKIHRNITSFELVQTAQETPDVPIDYAMTFGFQNNQNQTLRFDSDAELSEPLINIRNRQRFTRETVTLEVAKAKGEQDRLAEDAVVRIIQDFLNESPQVRSLDDALQQLAESPRFDQEQVNYLKKRFWVSNAIYHTGNPDVNPPSQGNRIQVRVARDQVTPGAYIMGRPGDYYKILKIAPHTSERQPHPLLEVVRPDGRRFYLQITEQNDQGFTAQSVQRQAWFEATTDEAATITEDEIRARFTSLNGDDLDTVAAQLAQSQSRASQTMRTVADPNAFHASVQQANRLLLDKYKENEDVTQSDLEVISERVGVHSLTEENQWIAGILRGTEKARQTEQGLMFFDLREARSTGRVNETEPEIHTQFLPSPDVPFEILGDNGWLARFNALSHNNNLVDVADLMHNFNLIRPLRVANRTELRVLLDYGLYKIGMPPLPHDYDLTRDILYLTPEEIANRWQLAYQRRFQGGDAAPDGVELQIFSGERARYADVRDDNFEDKFLDTIRSDNGSDELSDNQLEEIEKMKRALVQFHRFIENPRTHPLFIDGIEGRLPESYHACTVCTEDIIPPFLEQAGISSYRFITLLPKATSSGINSSHSFVIVEIAGVEFVLDLTAHQFEYAFSSLATENVRYSMSAETEALFEAFRQKLGVVMIPLADLNRHFHQYFFYDFNNMVLESRVSRVDWHVDENSGFPISSQTTVTDVVLRDTPARGHQPIVETQGDLKLDGIHLSDTLQTVRILFRQPGRAAIAVDLNPTQEWPEGFDVYVHPNPSGEDLAHPAQYDPEQPQVEAVTGANHVRFSNTDLSITGILGAQWRREFDANGVLTLPKEGPPVTWGWSTVPRTYFAGENDVYTNVRPSNFDTKFRDRLVEINGGHSLSENQEDDIRKLKNALGEIEQFMDSPETYPAIADLPSAQHKRDAIQDCDRCSIDFIAPILEKAKVRYKLVQLLSKVGSLEDSLGAHTFLIVYIGDIEMVLGATEFQFEVKEALGYNSIFRPAYLARMEEAYDSARKDIGLVMVPYEDVKASPFWFYQYNNRIRRESHPASNEAFIIVNIDGEDQILVSAELDFVFTSNHLWTDAQLGDLIHYNLEPIIGKKGLALGFLFPPDQSLEKGFGLQHIAVPIRDPNDHLVRTFRPRPLLRTILGLQSARIVSRASGEVDIHLTFVNGHSETLHYEANGLYKPDPIPIDTVTEADVHLELIRLGLSSDPMLNSYVITALRNVTAVDPPDHSNISDALRSTLPHGYLNEAELQSLASRFSVVPPGPNPRPDPQTSGWEAVPGPGRYTPSQASRPKVLLDADLTREEVAAEVTPILGQNPKAISRVFDALDDVARSRRQRNINAALTSLTPTHISDSDVVSLKQRFSLDPLQGGHVSQTNVTPSPTEIKEWKLVLQELGASGPDPVYLEVGEVLGETSGVAAAGIFDAVMQFSRTDSSQDIRAALDSLIPSAINATDADRLANWFRPDVPSFHFVGPLANFTNVRSDNLDRKLRPSLVELNGWQPLSSDQEADLAQLTEAVKELEGFMDDPESHPAISELSTPGERINRIQQCHLCALHIVSRALNRAQVRHRIISIEPDRQNNLPEHYFVVAEIGDLDVIVGGTEHQFDVQEAIGRDRFYSEFTTLHTRALNLAREKIGLVVLPFQLAQRAGLSFYRTAGRIRVEQDRTTGIQIVDTRGAEESKLVSVNLPLEFNQGSTILHPITNEPTALFTPLIPNQGPRMGIFLPLDLDLSREGFRFHFLTRAAELNTANLAEQLSKEDEPNLEMRTNVLQVEVNQDGSAERFKTQIFYRDGTDETLFFDANGNQIESSIGPQAAFGTLPDFPRFLAVPVYGVFMPILEELVRAWAGELFGDIVFWLVFSFLHAYAHVFVDRKKYKFNGPYYKTNQFQYRVMASVAFGGLGFLFSGPALSLFSSWGWDPVLQRLADLLHLEMPLVGALIVSTAAHIFNNLILYGYFGRSLAMSLYETHKGPESPNLRWRWYFSARNPYDPNTGRSWEQTFEGSLRLLDTYVELIFMNSGQTVGTQVSLGDYNLTLNPIPGRKDQIGAFLNKTLGPILIAQRISWWWVLKEIDSSHEPLKRGVPEEMIYKADSKLAQVLSEDSDFLTGRLVGTDIYSIAKLYVGFLAMELQRNRSIYLFEIFSNHNDKHRVTLEAVFDHELESTGEQNPPKILPFLDAPREDLLIAMVALTGFGLYWMNQLELLSLVAVVFVSEKSPVDQTLDLLKGDLRSHSLSSSLEGRPIEQERPRTPARKGWWDEFRQIATYKRQI